MKTSSQAFMAVSLRLPIEDKAIKDRLSRAYDIVTKGGYQLIRMDEEMYLVEKLSTSLFEDVSARYIVSTEGQTCTCPDFPSVRAGLCKHRIAVMLRREMEE